MTGPIGWEEKKGLRLTSLELPLSAEGIYLFSRAVGVSGSVKIEQDASLHDRHSMVVDIGVPMMTSDRLGSLKVCRLERKGQKGVGIFVRCPYYPILFIWLTGISVVLIVVLRRAPDIPPCSHCTGAQEPQRTNLYPLLHKQYAEFLLRFSGCGPGD